MLGFILASQIGFKNFLGGNGFKKPFQNKIFSINKTNSNKKKLKRAPKNFLKTTALLGPSGGFFGVGSSEILVIGVVAWFILGPKRLYQLARDIGRISAEFKNVTDEARSTFQKAVDTDIKESVKEEKSSVKKVLNNFPDESESRLSELNNLIDSEISTISKEKK